MAGVDSKQFLERFMEYNAMMPSAGNRQSYKTPDLQ